MEYLFCQYYLGRNPAIRDCFVSVRVRVRVSVGIRVRLSVGVGSFRELYTTDAELVLESPE